MFQVKDMIFEKTELGARVTFIHGEVRTPIEIEPAAAARIERWLRAWAGNDHVRHEWVVGDTTTVQPGRGGALVLANASSQVRFEYYTVGESGWSFADIQDVSQIIALMVRVQKAHSRDIGG